MAAITGCPARASLVFLGGAALERHIAKGMAERSAAEVPQGATGPKTRDLCMQAQRPAVDPLVSDRQLNCVPLDGRGRLPYPVRGTYNPPWPRPACMRSRAQSGHRRLRRCCRAPMTDAPSSRARICAGWAGRSDVRRVPRFLPG